MAKQIISPVSPLAKEIQPSIERFLITNINLNKNESLTPEDGAKMIANAIAYGIAKAFTSLTVSAAFGLGTALPSNDPVGTKITTALKSTSTEG